MISWSFDDCNNKWKWCNDWLKITWTEGSSGLIITQKPNWYVCYRNPQGTDLRKQADPAWYLAAWPSGMDVGDKLNSRLEQELIFSASSGGRMWNTQPKWTHGPGRAKWYILCSKTLNAWISLSPLVFALQIELSLQTKALVYFGPTQPYFEYIATTAKYNLKYRLRC